MKILRFKFGPNQYLRKELLWSYLDELAERLINYYKKNNNKPNWIHAHYADAGYVAAKLSDALNIPFVFTGHSLGREKKRKLLDTGLNINQIDNLYFINKRIQAEEEALKSANIIVTSTKQESVYQYSQYVSFSPHKATVIPPGGIIRCFIMFTPQPKLLKLTI